MNDRNIITSMINFFRFHCKIFLCELTPIFLLEPSSTDEAGGMELIEISVKYLFYSEAEIFTPL